MAQLVRMDAHLDTLSDELCQVNTRVGRIAQRQAAMGGFTTYSPSPPTSEDESDDGPTVMMLMRTIVLARPVMMRWLLDLLTIYHS